MQLSKLLSIACTVGLLGGAMAATGGAQDMNSRDRTYFTFSTAIQVPGHRLTAGKYMFQLLDSPGNRHVVQVYNAQGTRLLANLMALPNERIRPADKTVVTLFATPSSKPYAIRSWFYPGRTVGHEFVYPKRQAEEIARATRQSVLAVDADSSITAVRPSESRQASRTDVPAEPQTRLSPSVGTARAETPQARDAQAPSAGPAAASTTPQSKPDRELPDTASNLPLTLFVGLVALGGASLVRSLRGMIS